MKVASLAARICERRYCCFAFLYRKDIELLEKTDFWFEPRKMSVCVYVCVCLYVCALFDFQSIRARFSEMAGPIWTNLGSFESYYRAIDQVRRAYGYHFRFRRYTH